MEPENEVPEPLDKAPEGRTPRTWQRVAAVIVAIGAGVTFLQNLAGGSASDRAAGALEEIGVTGADNECVVAELDARGILEPPEGMDFEPLDPEAIVSGGVSLSPEEQEWLRGFGDALDSCLGPDGVLALEDFSNLSIPEFEEWRTGCAEYGGEDCDLLFVHGFSDEDVAFAGTCGERLPEGTNEWCLIVFGDGPQLEDWYEACNAGDNARCDLLGFFAEPGTRYAEAVATCGGQTEEALIPCAALFGLGQAGAAPPPSGSSGISAEDLATLTDEELDELVVAFWEAFAPGDRWATMPNEDFSVAAVRELMTGLCDDLDSGTPIDEAADTLTFVVKAQVPAATGDEAFALAGLIANLATADCEQHDDELVAWLEQQMGQ